MQDCVCRTGGPLVKEESRDWGSASNMKSYTSAEIAQFVSVLLSADERPLRSDTSYPRISIVTPSFNQGEFLERTIVSVLNQHYPNLEYMILDGGSTDNSVQVIQKYERYLTHWSSEKDGGTADALAKGFARTSGGILAWVNSDDLYMPGALDAVAAAFSRDRDSDVIYGNSYYIDAGDRVLKERRRTPFSRFGFLYDGLALSQPATFWRRQAFDECGGIDQQYPFAFDTDFFFRLLARQARFGFMRRFLAGFRVHPNSATSKRWLSVGKGEDERIRNTYCRYPLRSFPGSLLRQCAHVQRCLWYVCQGDSPWLFRTTIARALGFLSGARSSR